MPTDLSELLATFKTKLLKSILHLEYSYRKIENLDSAVENLSLEELEHWESFSARFGRAADLFLSKYLRTYVLHQDPGFRGSFRDQVNQGEKLGILSETSIWIKIRELRNISAHEYEEEKLSALFEDMRKLAPYLVDLRNKI